MTHRLDVYNIEKAKKEWNEALDNIPWQYQDLYFSSPWYRIWEDNGYGSAICLHSEIDGTHFFYPFLFRQIDGYDLPEIFFDTETAYGYGGILVTDTPSLECINKFNNAVDEWMAHHNVIAEFIRFSPELNAVPVRNCSFTEVRTDTFLDINNRPIDFLWDCLLSSKTRNILRKSSRYNLNFSINHDLTESIRHFFPIYSETAERLAMDNFYKFSEKFFGSFATNMMGTAIQVDVHVENQIAASSLWLHDKKKLRYFLGATSNRFSGIPCTDAYIWEVISYAIKTGLAETLCFGGGLTVDSNDSLFKFKKKYSNRTEKVFVGKKIHNPNSYINICQQWKRNYPALVNRHEHKLLCYRQKL